MRFAKYHGCGNDFIITRAAELPERSAADEAALGALARRVCHRQLGVGADGLIIARGGVRSGPLTMDIYNSDGSRAPMCGNGIRCFAHYCVSEGLVARDADTFDVATLAGMMRVRVFDEGEDGFSAEIAMGKPDFSARAAGIDEDGEYLRRTLNVCGRDIVLSGLFMGTYHAVVWTDENDIGAEGPLGLYRDAVLMRIGGVLSEYPAFTQRINVNFAHIVDRENVEMITWERGAGLTAACGTGACAVTALGILEDRLGCAVRVALPYGTLSIRRADDGTMFMRGPAVRVFTGEEAL